MKKLFIFLSLSLSLSLVKADYWTQKASLPADDRAAAAGFSLNGKGYIGTGIKFGGPTQFHDDFWEYNPVANSWLQKAGFGGTARSGAVGFSVLGKGYIACGYDANIVQQDVWQYDPLLNAWTQKASLPGPGRNYTVAFAIDSFAYIGTGYNSSSTNYQDFWQYNPVANSWLQKADVGGSARSSAIGFSSNGKGSIGGGYSATYVNDFWQYDPALNTWTQKANIPPGGRSDASAFIINGYGYVLTGQTSINMVNDLWKYDYNSNTWIQKVNLTGQARTNAVAFGIGNKGYIGTGWNASFLSLNDLWEYTADSTTSIEETKNFNLEFSIFPNPVKDILVINSVYPESIGEFMKKGKIEITISDTQGKNVFYSQSYLSRSNREIIDHQSKISVSGLSKGLYFVEVAFLPDGERKGVAKAARMFLKE